MRFSMVALATVVGCGGPPKIEPIKIGPVPPKMTKGTLTSTLCREGVCTCRTGNEDIGVPEDDRKRFEIRLGSTYDLWLTMPDTVLYKSPETAEGCFYVDLPPGKHTLELRASNDAGVSFDLQVKELGTKTKSWYDTFTFRCGHPGVCSFRELDDRKAELAAVKRNLHDACGSTKVKNVIWDHGRAPDHEHPSELAVRFTLDVYKFAPDKAHGDPSCGTGDAAGADPANDPAP